MILFLEVQGSHLIERVCSQIPIGTVQGMLAYSRDHQVSVEDLWYWGEVGRPYEAVMKKLLGKHHGPHYQDFGVPYRAIPFPYDGIPVEGCNDLSGRITIRHSFGPDKRSMPPADDELDCRNVACAVRELAKDKPDQGMVHACSGELKEGGLVYYWFDDIDPPVRPEKITLILDDLEAFGYDGFVLREVTYDGKAAIGYDSDYLGELRRGYDVVFMDA